LTRRRDPSTIRAMQGHGGGQRVLKVVPVDPATIARPVPPEHCTAAFAGGADFRGTTAAGRVPVTVDRVFGWFEPGASEFRSAGFEGRSILWDVHPTDERCLVHVGDWMEETVHEIDLATGRHTLVFDSPRGLTAVYAGTDRVATTFQGKLELYAHAAGSRETPRLVDTLDQVATGRLVGTFHAGRELLLKASGNADRSPVFRHLDDQLTLLGEIKDDPAIGFRLQTFFESAGRVFLVPFGRKSELIFELLLD
jgi:hypothetical protein